MNLNFPLNFTIHMGEENFAKVRIGRHQNKQITSSGLNLNENKSEHSVLQVYKICVKAFF